MTRFAIIARLIFKRPNFWEELRATLTHFFALADVLITAAQTNHDV